MEPMTLPPLLKRIFYGLRVGLAIYIGAVLVPWMLIRWIDGHTMRTFPEWSVNLTWVVVAPLAVAALLWIASRRFGWVVLVAAFPLTHYCNEMNLANLFAKNLRKGWVAKFESGGTGRLAISRGNFNVYPSPDRGSPPLETIQENNAVSILKDEGTLIKVRLDDGREGYAFPGDQYYDLKKEDFIKE